MTPLYARSRRRSRAGRCTVPPLKPSSRKQSSGSTLQPSATIRCRSAATWLWMVSSSACRSELTRAYNATHIVLPMTLSPPCDLGVHTPSFTIVLVGWDAARLGLLADHRPNLLESQRPQLLLQA